MLPDLLSPGLARRGVAALVAASLLLAAWPLPAQTINGAAEARALAPGLVPDAKTLFQLEDGTITLDGGGEIPLEQLFPGEGNATPLADAYGDEAATVDLGHGAQEQLLNAPTGAGEAYRTLLDSPYDGPRDLSHEPWFDHTRTILGDIERLGGAFGRCVPTQRVGTSPRTVWQPDLRLCTRPAQAPTTGACRIEHTLAFSEQNAFARVGVYGAETNSFRLDFAHGSWTQIAPSDGSHFAGEVPQLDQDELCADPDRVRLTLAAVGTWTDAAVPGELDGSITVTVPQQPSCANGLQAIVQLTDPGGDGKYKMGSELALHILGVTDAWWPQACLDIVLGQKLPPACTVITTALSPPDQQGCAEHDGRRICAGDPLWQAIAPPPFDPDETRLSRLAGGADIHWSCPAGTTTVPVADSCGPLHERPECRRQSTRCVAGTEDADGNCTVVEDSYDCGREVVIDDGGIRTELQCDGEVKCLGDRCTGGSNETNPNFAQLAAVLKGAELAALDGACNPETGECAVFTGQPASCKRVLAGTVDCCQDVQGVGLASYLQLAFAVAALDGAMATLDPTNPLRGGWEVMASPLSLSWNWIGGQFTSALNGITGSTTPAASAGEALGILGVARQQLMQATAQWTLETFGATAANALFTVNGGAAVAAGQAQAAATARTTEATMAAASVPGGTGRRPDVIERTLARTAQTDIPAALATARDELMPYLRPGGGAPKPRPEAYDRADIPPELLQPWRLPNRWQDQPPPEGGPVDPEPVDPGVPLPGPCGQRSGLPWASGVSPGTGVGAKALVNVTGFGT